MPEFWIATEGATAADDAICGPFPSPTKAEEYKERMLNGLGKVIAEGSADVLASQKWPRIKPLPIPPEVDPRAGIDAMLLAIGFVHAYWSKPERAIYDGGNVRVVIDEQTAVFGYTPAGRALFHCTFDATTPLPIILAAVRAAKEVLA